MMNNIKFKPISFSWVAIHPTPKGVVQFIGGAFFGTFPTFFYQYFLEKIYEAGYTIIALPFRFSFRHWPIALDLLKEQKAVRQELLKFNDSQANSVYGDTSKYFWIGHSLGCKYITLLEFLSTDSAIKSRYLDKTQYPEEEIASILDSADLKNASILDQASLLIAPDISDTESAIPFRPVAQLIDRLGLGVRPNRKQTQDLLEHSNLFNLTGLISFDKDTIAGSITDASKSEEIKKKSDVLWLLNYLQTKSLPVLNRELKGKHLEPLGWKNGKYIVDFNPFDKFVEPLKLRQLEETTVEFLEDLDRR